jgi:DHA1 family inner membrane transport protein
MRLPIILIVIAQFLGCTLWFSVNGVSVDLTTRWGLASSDIGLLTSAVQAGFIIGTLGLAISNVADRFALSHIFLCASVL